MLMDELEKALIANPQAKLIYTVPEFQNPTGITLAGDRRQRMVELADLGDVWTDRSRDRDISDLVDRRRAQTGSQESLGSPGGRVGALTTAMFSLA